MTKLQQQKGFTLVELAIVLTIIGLLIGGILKGQQLMQNARVTATIAQINSFEAATTSFRDSYNAMPGDLLDGDTKVAGCNAVCKINPALATSGDGKVGIKDWDMSAFQGKIPVVAPGNETMLYWYELQAAGYISAVNDDFIQGQAASFGGSIPAARIGGGFWVGNSTGIGTAAGLSPAPYTLLGTVLAMVAKPDGGATFALTGATQATQPLTPAVAGQIDRKIDDGLPTAGQVQAYGFQNSCFGGAAPYSYQEATVSKDCGLYLRVQR